MSTNRQELAEYFSLQGARVLMARYEGFLQSVPDDASVWRRELFPMVRGMWNAAEGGGRELYEVAAELRRAADLFEQHPDGSHHALKKLPKAETEVRTPKAYREIAAYVEGWKAPFDHEALHGTPLTVRELSLRFPRLSQILPIYFGQDGVAVSDDMQDSTAEDGIRMYISETHPGCLWQLPGVVAECAEALALFHTEDELDAFFSGGAMGGGSGSEDFIDFFPLFIRLCTEHMKEAHSPLRKQS
ncbi:hypothetical protein ACFS5L_12180 [Streptomyces phyllanthi]|uniref:Uncharacterized protein n=1 Tax=Streptomyces phyllanthi TaxID=1803180 RepID=A0A5N8W8X9_9ACTN|nr:hypothetical protein [Streptomyces phyllanthi]MPY42575.1 hypothetical protein [Streptomyces phyllanthi]